MSNMEAFNKIMSEIGEQLNEETITAIKAALEANDEPVQKPWAVARVDDLERGGRTRALAMMLSLDAPLYTTPPQRTWIGLTDEETTELVHKYAFYNLVREVEDKLKEKNT